MKKILILLLIFVTSCSEDPIENSIPATSSVEDCNLPNTLACESDSTTRISYCIICNICQTDEWLSNEKSLVLTSETLPDRTGNSYDTIQINDNTIFSGEVCVPTIPNQDSLVIGLLFQNDEERLNFAVYEKIEVSTNGITEFQKEITINDIWEKPPCTMYSTLVGIHDPSKEQDYLTCIVGSPGDCFFSYVDQDPVEFEKQLRETEEEWLEWYENQETSTPCGEIYNRILD